MPAGAPMADCRPTICLSMIVRDEAHIVREVIDSVAPHIDYWVIVDTGSTDATIETICSRMAAKGLPGDIHERPWRDFGSNRTEALNLCRGRADYIWVIDADDLVVGDLDLSRLRADSYLLRYGDEFRYWRRQIFRDGLRWRYLGVVHEYPMCLDPATEERLDGEYYIDSRRLGSRSRLPEKHERDCLLLREAVERDPDDTRSVFYLAQSHFDAGDYADALDWYTRRAEMGGWGEEISYSLLRRAACLTQLDEPWDRALAAYLDAWQARPTRAEPLYEIARYYRLAGSFELGYLFAKRASEIPYPEDDSLFISADVYGWRALDELAICAYYTGRHEESFELSAALLDGSALPEWERPRIEANRDFCVPWIEEQRSAYPAELVERVARESALDADVTLTITSCRRPELFERTVNSFLRCCTDIERIGRWICVDNGSAEVDRARMRELYPFLEFIYTEPPEQRHPQSMNLLRETVNSPFWLHLEDDWQFFWRGPYVTRALEILGDDPSLAQVAFNRNYGETLECRGIVGGELRRTGTGLRYRQHEHVERETPAWERHLAALPAGARTVAYWPHFTLRSSLMRTPAVKSVESFQAGTGHFELEFAERFAAAGLRTAFFDTITSLHTGRLTSEGPGEGRVSAYDLIGNGAHPARPAQIEAPSVIDESLVVRVINLDRRPDRWTSFRAAVRTAAGAGFAARCQRFAGVDGTQLSETSEIRRLFRGNDFGLRRGMVGCALSHISVWRSLAARGERSLELILEDDARPVQGFDRKLAAILHELRDGGNDFDLALLGHHSTAPQPPTDSAGGTKLRPMRWEPYIGGSFAYVLSSRGAQKLVELVERDGVQNGIDWFVMFKQAELRVLECDPPLVTAPLALARNNIDSDIQHDYVSVTPAPARTSTRGCIRVRMLANWCSSRELCELFNRMTTEEQYEWHFRGLDGTERRLRMTWADDNEPPDYWVVINAPPAGEDAEFEPDRTVVFQMEPLMWTEAMRERWGRWAAPSPLSFLQVRDHRRYRNSNDWWVGPSYAELRDGPPPEKSATMAACASTKYFDPGHVRRIDFLRFLDRRDIDIDIYGDPGNGFRRWRSAAPPHDKSRALLPYRYYFDAENNRTPNFYTEKIVDCVLAETLCFYWGCPNLDSFLDPRAFVRLELEDFEADLARIREAIASDEWSKRLPYIRAEKRRILDEYQFFPTLARVLDPGRRAGRWHISEVDRALVDGLIGERRCGTFVEISDRAGAPECSETLDVERRLDWTGLCLEADPVRVRAARRVRDCTIADDSGHERVESVIARNGLSPIAIDWLNLAVRDPDALIAQDGRLDLERVRPNMISMPTAPTAERRRAVARLERFGYREAPGSSSASAPIAMVRDGRADIFGFYHLCTINNWREVLEEQLERWADSGLAAATRRIFASVVGPRAQEGGAALAAACGQRLEVIYMSEDRSDGERPVLEYARGFCEHEEPLAKACWYMHAKGVSEPQCRNPAVADWRRLMEHFVVERWQDCVEGLENHDACGVNWHQAPAPHFSGNFWWAKPRYLASLPLHIGPAHFDPERWIGSNQPHVLCLHESGVDHYLEPYPPAQYLGRPRESTE